MLVGVVDVFSGVIRGGGDGVGVGGGGWCWWRRLVVVGGDQWS